jgi:hypothetical protein
MLTPSPTLDNYGYLWWLNRGATAKPDVPATAVYALGAGTNAIWLDPGAGPRRGAALDRQIRSGRLRRPPHRRDPLSGSIETRALILRSRSLGNRSSG